MKIILPNNMDIADQEVSDARMGDVMGFTSFGSRPEVKKRKTSHVDQPVTSTTAHVTTPLANSGFQNTQILTHNPAQITQLPTDASSTSPTSEQPKNAFPTGVPMDIFNKLTWKELEAYRKGVKNENGDIAWFLPSFIEDPWAKLEKSAN
ncbi:uncharacterized protein PV09_09606 [Verruconis gallopava]|uniref:Uncharacterized protein n=1 Tax=Verruconis gallopava TaxID=253628 RepID=A0A0D1ZX46_9PEZI|nr:uncharacterized protein PV09_09606 [Verruconis gallopava]KIV98614.1 hypothetical protein PV09_09606 [Verruconis gallopava]